MLSLPLGLVWGKALYAQSSVQASGTPELCLGKPGCHRSLGQDLPLGLGDSMLYSARP